MLENYPGFDQGISGMEFAERLTNQAQRFGVEMLQATAVEDIGRDGRYLCVKTSAGNEYGARAVLIATGSRYRRLNVPGERELIGSAIHFCATCDGPFYKGKDVVVVGGGNSGFQEGSSCSSTPGTSPSSSFCRRSGPAGCSKQKVAEQPNMSVVPNHAIQAFQAERGKLKGVEVLDRATGESESLASRRRLHLRRPQPQQRLPAGRNPARPHRVHRDQSDAGDHDARRVRCGRRARGQHQAGRLGRGRRRDRRDNDPGVSARTMKDHRVGSPW